MKEEQAKTFSENLERLMKARGITAYKLGQDSGVSAAYLYKLLPPKGDTRSHHLPKRLGMDVVTNLARVLGVTPDALLGNENIEEAEEQATESSHREQILDTLQRLRVADLDKFLQRLAALPQPSQEAIASLVDNLYDGYKHHINNAQIIVIPSPTEEEDVPVKRGRGRPKGSKNRT